MQEVEIQTKSARQKLQEKDWSYAIERDKAKAEKEVADLIVETLSDPGETEAFLQEWNGTMKEDHVQMSRIANNAKLSSAFREWYQAQNMGGRLGFLYDHKQVNPALRAESGMRIFQSLVVKLVPWTIKKTGMEYARD